MVWDPDFDARQAKAREDKRKADEKARRDREGSVFASGSQGSGRSGGGGGCVLVLVIALASVLLAGVGLLAPKAQASPTLANVGQRPAATVLHTNHLTSFDCEINDEQRGPYSNVSMGIRWVNSATVQKMVQFSIHNWDNRPYTITVRYQRFTDGHVYKQQGITVGSTSTYTWISGNGADWDGSGGHSQVYHAGVKVYRDSTYVMSLDLWYDSYRGKVTWVADLTNCTPSSLDGGLDGPALAQRFALAA